MSSGKLIVVFGATGTQGGSVANALIKDGRFKLRLVSRNADNPKLQVFKDLGAEVVQGDQDDLASMRKAFHGAYGTFIVTNFFTDFDGEKETMRGINSVKAAKQCGVQHIVFSGLENSKRRYGIEVPHFDSKGRVEDFMEENKYPFTSVRVAFYFDNWINFMPPYKVDENTFVLNLPMGSEPMGGIAVDDIGPCVLGVFSNPDKYLGKFVGLAGSLMSPSEYADIMTKVFPDKTFSQSSMTRQEMAAQGWQGADDMAAMFALYATGKAIRSPPETMALYPAVMDFETWLLANKEKFATKLV